MTDTDLGRLDGPSQVEPVPVSPVPASVPSAWQVASAKAVVDLIRDVGIYRLGGSEGCPCTNFEVRSVGVSVSCHKSGDHGLRVWSNHMDYADEKYETCVEALRPIANEVLRQVDEYYGIGGDYAADFEVRFSSWEQDNPRSNILPKGTR